MAVWDNTGNLGSSWGWYCDLGPYTGEWPPSPPVPENLPDTMDEVDYVIGVLDPGDPTGFASGIYLDMWRTWDGTPGSSTTTPDFSDHGAVEDPGNHIVVVGYAADFTSEPTPAPDTVVPFLYSALGTGFAIGRPSEGHWVDVPLDGYDGVTGFFFNSVGKRLDMNFNSSPVADFPSSTAAGSAADYLAAYKAVASGTVQNWSTGVGVGFGADTFKSGATWFSQPDGNGAGNEVSDEWGVVGDPDAFLPSASDFGDFPDWISSGNTISAPFIDWVEGRDYAHPPGLGLYDFPTFGDWTDYVASADWTSDVTVTITPGGSNQDSQSVGHASEDFAVLVITGDPGLPGAGSSLSIPTTPDGTQVATVTATIVGTGGDNTPVDVTFTPPSGQAFAVHLRFDDVAGITLPLSSYAVSASRYGWYARMSAFTADYAQVVTGMRVWVPGEPVTGDGGGGDDADGWWGVQITE